MKSINEIKYRITNQEEPKEYIIENDISPMITYPNITFGEYMSQRITKHNSNAIAFVSKHSNWKIVIEYCFCL